MSMIVKQKKDIIDSILKKEIEENNLDIKYYSLYRINYYNSDSFKSEQKKLINKIDKKLNIIFPFKANARFDNVRNEIIIFLDKICIIPGISRSLISLLKTAYHELFHAIQQKEMKNLTNISYDLFASICDDIILVHPKFNNLNNYDNPEYHDSLMAEILANLYGVKKTKEYLKNNNIVCKPYEIEQLEEESNLYKSQYINYDLTKRLNLIISEYKKGIKIGFLKKAIFELFLNDDASVKNINIIFSNNKVLELDPKILIALIKTDVLKKAINETALTEETSYIINELLTKGSIALPQKLENKKLFSN